MEKPVAPAHCESSAVGLTIRKATPEDAEFIARGFLDAVGMTEEEMLPILPCCIDIALMGNTLYSWRNSLIAQWNGVDAGVLIAYDGATYKEASRITFEIVRDRGGEDFTGMTQETEPGEWYIDTLSVLPQFRRRGIATRLLQYAIEMGRENPATSKVTLYVDPEHPWVVDLYRSVGFEPTGEAFIFGQIYRKMER